MRVASSAFGLEGRIDYLPQEKSPHPIASIDLRFTGREKDTLYEAIWKRCTNRKLYDRRPLNQNISDHLCETASSIPGVRLHLLKERSSLKRLARAIYMVDRIRTEHRSLHQHLNKMIRFTEKEALEKRDGFPLKNLEAGFAGEIFLKCTKSWSVMNIMNKMGPGRMVALHSYQAMVASSAAALVTVSGMETEDFLRGGQCLERIWLSLTRQGLSMQPMAAVSLFWLRWQIEGPISFSEKHQKSLKRVWIDCQDLFPEVDFSKEWHVMLFRVGSGSAISQRTYRKDVDSLII
jgi:hypothetical protein